MKKRYMRMNLAFSKDTGSTIISKVGEWMKYGQAGLVGIWWMESARGSEYEEDFVNGVVRGCHWEHVVLDFWREGLVSKGQTWKIR